MNRFSFTIFLILFFVQKGFNFALKELLNPFIFVSTSETILEYFCPEGFTKTVHACFDLRNYFRIFLSRKVACFGIRNCFRIFLSRRVCLICSCLLWPRKVFESIFVRKGLLSPFMFVLPSETLLEYFCQERFTRFVQI